MNHVPFQRLLTLGAALCLVACSFDPSVARPGSESGDTEPGNGSGDVTVPGDADRPEDASGVSDVRTPDDMRPPPPDTSPPPPDGSQPDLGPTDTSPPPDMMPPPPDMTDPGMGVCDGMMVDHESNPEHCGECDNACDPDYGSCEAGRCTCDEGIEPCGPANACTDTAYDPLNCGMCGRACAVGEVCLQGSCVCRPELMRCNGACVDTNVDPSHCGTCNNDCMGKACDEGSCRDGGNCPILTWSCNRADGKACIRGDEHDLHCDPGLGDACGTECLGNEICVDPGFLSGPECVTYRPAIGCDDCPCPDCSANEACVTTEDIPDVAYCLSR